MKTGTVLEGAELDNVMGGGCVVVATGKPCTTTILNPPALTWDNVKKGGKAILEAVSKLVDRGPGSWLSR